MLAYSLGVAPMVRNLLNLVARPAGPNVARTTYESFLAKLTQFSAESLVAGFNQFAWKAWRGEFDAEANALSGATGPILAMYGLAMGATEPNAPRANFGDIIDLHFEHLAIESVPEPLLREHERALAKAAINTDLAVLLPDLRAARLAATACILARVHRSQLVASRSSLDELSKIWWIAKRVDLDAEQLSAAQRMLGMEVPVFVRAASAILGFAVTHELMGCVFVERNIEQAFLEKYDVDQDVLKLAASKLSTTRDDLRRWLESVASKFPEGAKQFVPAPLLTTPLLSLDQLDLVDGPPYLCPSLHHFISAVRDRVREAISLPGALSRDTEDLYGQRLVDYVKAAVRAAGANVIDLDDIERRTQRRADLLLVEHDAALIVEIKRALATGGLSKHLLYPAGIVAVLKHLLGALRQCEATYERRPWRSQGLEVTHCAAVILVDEPVGAEGALFADLYGAQTQPTIPFEVMSVVDFENAVGVLGVGRLERLIHQKWMRGYRDLPLAIFAKNVCKIAPQSVAGKRTHLEAEDRELFFETALVASDFAAEWP